MRGSQQEDGPWQPEKYVDLSGLGRGGVYKNANRLNLCQIAMVRLAGMLKEVSAGVQVGWWLKEWDRWQRTSPSGGGV
jgi:hypothetical protein